jgi:hypothetical protein
VKTILRVFKCRETLEREFDSIEEAEGFVKLMYKRRPDVILEPNVDRTDNCVVGVFDLDREELREGTPPFLAAAPTFSL